MAHTSSKVTPTYSNTSFGISVRSAPSLL
ncbi:hypothetical protein PSPO01_16139 [Paraphaeosphaeria sporulosa]